MAALTPYATELRYEIGGEAVDEDEYREAVRLAETVVTWAEGVIAERTIPGGDAEPDHEGAEAVSQDDDA